MRLIGDDAGFLNVPKIKGSHAAIKTGLCSALKPPSRRSARGRSHDELAAYPKAYESSWLHDELWRARNFKPWMNKGLLIGTLMAGMDQKLFGGKAPWTLHAHKTDAQKTKPAAQCKRIDYPKPDNKLSFDRLSSVFLSSTNHEENQPCHLTLKDPTVPIRTNLAIYDAPEQRYCPAGVYEIVREWRRVEPAAADQRAELRALQDLRHQGPTQNIVWVNPEGGGGPNYPNM